jgi:polyhydroxyalkanoate synthase
MLMKTTPPAGSRERAGSPWLGEASAPSDLFLHYQEIERTLGAWPLPWLAGLAPATASGAFMDWLTHLAASPAKQWELAHLAGQLLLQGWQAALRGFQPGDADAMQPLPQDKRFADPAWQQPPFAALAQAFLLQQHWWQAATRAVPGLNRHHEQMVAFAARQWLDLAAPSNFVPTNPVVLQRTLREAGANLLRGAAHALEDSWREALDLPPAGTEGFQPGVNVAVTPGRVVLRNRLIELIQYTPTTPTTHPEPVLLVPAWIMKYYVLDLSPHNSLVKYLVDQGFTVFAISWKNPGSEDRDLGLEDYYRLGVRAALDAVAAIVPGTPVHAAGYCLGGTLLAMAAAAMGREGRERHAAGQPPAGAAPPLASITLLAAQTDFSDPGEISLFIDESQVAHLENRMWRQGYLDKAQMKRTFQMLRSNDLVWSYRVVNHLLGERQPVSDLMAWNADGTRLPLRMHMQYLHAMFLDNALAHGQFQLEGTPINLNDIRVPVFNVGTTQDHVAPWRSVFKLHAMTDADQTFVLTAGGHNVGIVNPPGQARSSFRRRDWHAGDRLLTAEEWLEATPSEAGSWWPAWAAWLAQHSSSPRRKPPRLGAGTPAEASQEALGPAPGSYVHQH